MFDVFDHPWLVFVGSIVLLAASAWLGFSFRRHRSSEDNSDEDFSFVLGGTLTLLGLLIGFTFSMAVGRYDQRKNLEDQEANAIGTEYLRLDLLPANDAPKMREFLRRYLDLRIAFYTSRGPALDRIDEQTGQLQSAMWSIVAAHASAQPTPVAALVTAGMNDLLDAQGHTQAGYWNRIPRAAWLLLLAISMFCNLLIGYGAHARKASSFLVLPIALSITLFLVADIESPRGGMIRVRPQNLHSLAESLRPH